jgi:hypothetical protein
MIRKCLRVYFWFICMLIAVYTIFYFDDGVPLEFLDYVDWVFTLISLSGVYAYCYSKPFLSIMFWKVFLVLLIIWDLFFVSSAFTEDTEVYSGEFGLTVIVIVVFACLYIFLLVPSYIALYLLPKEFENDDSYKMEAKLLFIKWRGV